MAGTRRSLSEIYHRRALVPGLIACSLVLLVVGLSLPIVTIQKHILFKTVENTYSVAAGVKDLAASGEYVLAAIVFFFSMIFPFAKLLALWWLWSVKLYEAERKLMLHWLGNLGKWSMLDVFAVAILVVLAKLRTLTQVEPRVGIYFFGAAIIMSMSTTAYVDRLVRAARTSAAGPPRAKAVEAATATVTRLKYP